MLRTLLHPLLRLVAQLLFRVEFRNPHNTSFDARKLLIVANHESFLDGLLLGLFLPVNPVFVVNTQIAKVRWFKLVLGLVDHLTVDPANPMAMKTILKLVESGRPVVIFPEGRITVTSALMKVYEGPAFVAAKTDATVVPVRLDGPARSYFSRLTGQHPRHLFPKVVISVQPATALPMPVAPTAKLRRYKAGETLRRIMQEMLFATRAPQTLFDAFMEASDNFGRQRRMVEDVKQVEYSYGDLQRMILMLGRLASKFTAPGERVGLLLPNLAPTLGLLVGLSAFRRVPAMLNYTAGTEGMQNACIAADIKTLITSRAFLEQGKLVEKVQAIQNIRIVYLEDLREQVTLADKLWWIGYARWFPRAAGNHGDHPRSPEDSAVVLFTSGSEGKPKGVVLSHRAILANIAQIRAIVDFNVEDKVLNALPIFHSFGLTAGCLLPLMTGTRLFLYPSPLHYRVIPELAYDRGCSILFGTSTFLGHYGKFAHPYDFFRLRYVVAGAEKLSAAVKELWFEKFGVRIFEGYGATETAPVLAVNNPMAYRSGTVGQLLPGIAHKLIPVPGIDRGGILHVHGPNVMSGYYRFENPGVIEPPKSDAGEGWYDTGDVVDVDEDGFVHILGRVKRFAKIAGEMISLEVVEKIAASASPAKQHAASSQPDASKGEALVLFTTDKELGRDRLQAAAKASGLPELAVPRKIVVVEALPLLGTGKTDYVTLKKMAENA
ncbi:MAG: bifunctional acyl-ACP--phospholipid O-acyltransferase/long-chain-fatty-acid--ACP ligase [Rhodocyclaceae bacterium]|nr:MAG: bifunctional acyl-ACP--phospholipid O-acyltransferase/long-chain-fatty-acid--ACP ligase [Rhodocyclaceae bacterium]